MRFEKYTDQLNRLPKTCRQVIGHTENDNIIVYQAFNPLIAGYAVKHNRFGGEHYSFSRMSWIKPGFLWMMYRAGWATKEHQQRILAITLPVRHFKTILANATVSSYHEDIYSSHDAWKQELERTEVRLQWDPDHDPLGRRQERKAIQLGMKGAILKQFCTEWIVRIEDITRFVNAEYEKVKVGNIEALQVPFEEILHITETPVINRLGLSL